MEERFDEQAGHRYFFNTKTGQSAWSPHELHDGVDPHAPEEAARATVSHATHEPQLKPQVKKAPEVMEIEAIYKAHNPEKLSEVPVGQHAIASNMYLH